ncbi:RNA-directed DNA polymerase [Prescottella equi]
MVASFAHNVDTTLSENVFSARLAKSGPFFTRKGTFQWKRWLKHVRRHLQRGEPWLIKTDLTAYFDTIKFDLLDAELQSLAVANDVRKTLSEMLQAWSPLQGAGLLQGPDAARILGNLYLAPVDAAMDLTGVGYSRYMDDIRITGSSKASVINGLRLLERECRIRGLILSPNKTTIHSGKEARTADKESARDSVLYFLRVGKIPLAKRRMRRLLNDSISDDGHLNARNFRFSLWRLTVYRDHYVLPKVLSRLDDLAPAASVVSEYLRPFINKPAVEQSLADYLTDSRKVRHPHLVFFLFAVMLDHPGPLPAAWTDAAATLMRDTAAPKELRGIAANLAAHTRNAAVIGWLRSSARTDEDPYFVRALLTALARVGALDVATVKTMRTRGPLLSRCVDHLSCATSLPSLASVRERVLIP